MSQKPALKGRAFEMVIQLIGFKCPSQEAFSTSLLALYLKYLAPHSFTIGCITGAKSFCGSEMTDI
jgi:hypothetical protein